MNELYIVLYLPSCRCDPIAVMKLEDYPHLRHMNLKENEIKLEMSTPICEGDISRAVYWILLYVKDKEEALEKALTLVEESEIPSDIYKLMKTDAENLKKSWKFYAPDKLIEKGKTKC